jgi:ATP-dependent DNA ligase
VNGEYRIYRIKQKEYLLERVDTPQINFLHDTIQPMLSESAKKPPVGDEYIYEVKWDGIRALITIEDGQIKIKAAIKTTSPNSFQNSPWWINHFAQPAEYLMQRLCV